MAAVAAAALVAAAGAAYSASEQQKATSKANKANLAQQAQAQQFLQANAAKAEGAHKKGIKAAEQGFSDATKSVGILGQAARRRLLRREKTVAGRADAQMASRGLYHSTAATNLQRGVRADTDLNLAAIDESVAQLHAQVFRDRARTMGSLHMAKMSIYGALGAQQTNVATAYPHQAANIGAGVGAAAGSIAQLLMMYGMQGGNQPNTKKIF